MQNENQDGSARIRHVPIKVEAREGGRKENWLDYNSEYQQYTGQQNSETGNHYSPNNAQPQTNTYNTSSIDINYKPQPPPRNSSPFGIPAQSGLSDTTNRSPQAANEHVEERKSRSWLRGKNKKAPSKDRVKTVREKSSNTDKLVNSPEPIPLPPPQSTELKQQPQSDQPGSGNQSNTASQPGSHQGRANQGQPDPAASRSDADAAPKTPSSTISQIKRDINLLLQDIVKFDGITAKSKDYRYLDEMLTRCMLNLDKVECGRSPDLRMQRKEAIGFVDKATDILQRKLQVNTDIHNLYQSLQ